MRIAFVVPSFPNVSETFIYSQIVELITRGHEVEIFAFSKNKTIVNHEMIYNYNLLDKCNYYPKYTFKRLFFEIRFYLKIIVLKKKSKSKLDWLHLVDYFNFVEAKKWFKNRPEFDVIHVHFGIVSLPIVKAILKRDIVNSKLVVTFHGNDLDPSRLNSFKEIYHDLFSQANSFTVNTPYLSGILSSICNFKNKIHLLPVGLDTNKFNNSSGHSVRCADEPFCILFCGRLIKWKGPDIAIRIIDYLVKEKGIHNIELKIIGSGPMKEDLKRLINKLELQEIVFMLSEKSQEDLIIEMSKSHLLLLPGIHDPITNRAETQGLVVQEAQSMELPVLVSDAGGIKYGLLDGESGFVVRQNDIHEFADKIEYLIKNELIRQKMGEAGREFVRNNYDIKLLVDRLEGIYKS